MKIALVLLALHLPSVAFGMVFSWTDSAGVRHFTNREYEIPERYRARAKRLYPELSDTSAPQQNPQMPPQTQQAARTEPQAPLQPVLPDGQIRTQQPPVISESQKQVVRPPQVRRRRGFEAPEE